MCDGVSDWVNSVVRAAERLEPGGGRDTPGKCVEPWGRGQHGGNQEALAPPPPSSAGWTSWERSSDNSLLSTLGRAPHPR